MTISVSTYLEISQKEENISTLDLESKRKVSDAKCELDRKHKGM